jgi:hypothetical protein
MSEMEAWHHCPVCQKETIHMFSGSGTKGTCLTCDNELDPEVKAGNNKVISYNG